MSLLGSDALILRSMPPSFLTLLAQPSSLPASGERQGRRSPSMEEAASSSSSSHCLVGASTSSTTPPSSPAALPCTPVKGESGSPPSPSPSPTSSASAPAPRTEASPEDSSSTLSRPPLRPNPRGGARVVLIRHPQTEANAAHLLQGTTDSPLTALGEEQARGLAGWFAESRTRARGRGSGEGREAKEGGRDSQLGIDLALDPEMEMDVRLIVHSPLGRTTRLATLIHTALCDPGTSSTTSSSPSASPTPTLRASLDLQEKSFGPLECTRRGQHAGPQWPRAPVGLKQEGREEFARRVRRAGGVWIGKALEMGRLREEEQEEEEEELIKGEREEDDLPGHEEGGGDEPAKEKKRARSATPTPRPTQRKGPPTILIVTHGLFISTFFKLFPVLPPTASSAGGGRELGSDSRIPFASNTGMFILDVLPTPSHARSGAGYTLRLLKANWTPHLSSTSTAAPGAGEGGAGAGGKRSGTGREALASAARDPKQRRLDGVGGFFFKKPAGASVTATPMMGSATTAKTEVPGDKGGP